MTTNSVAPIKVSERIQSLDLLRGFALLGILIMNIVSFSHVGVGYINPTLGAGLEGSNGIVYAFNHLFADMRFMSLFSILFGAGVVLFSERVESKNLKAWLYHYRRMFWLLLFGLIHAYLIWMGDILTMYAICGSIVFLFRRRGTKTILIWAIIFFLVPIFFSFMTYFFTPESQLEQIFAFFTPSEGALAAETNAYRGSYMDQMEPRINGAIELQTIYFLIEQMWHILAMMLLGMWLYRKNIITGQRTSLLYRRLVYAGLISGLLISGVGLWRCYQHNWDGIWVMNIGHYYNYVASLLMALGYLGLIVLWSRTDWWEGLQNRLKAVGRMAFTNYILMSLICTFIFYGHGLGLFGKTDRLQNLGIVVLVWVILLVLSPAVLNRYQRGPLEGLWRRLTYWKKV